MASVKLCKVSDIPDGKMKVFDVKGKQVFVANVAGKFYCCDNKCTHVGGPLGEGLLDKTTVTCPWHGGQFDVTNGEVRRGPPQKDIKTYKATIKKGDIYINI